MSRIFIAYGYLIQALYSRNFSLNYPDMAEKRSIPTALGIVIGPAITYLSFLIFVSGFSEFAQCICFALLGLAGYDLARCRLSLTGILAVLFLPALPIAIYLGQSDMLTGNHLSAKIIICFWVASTLLGALYAGRNLTLDHTSSVKRLALLAGGLLVVVVGSYFR